MAMTHEFGLMPDMPQPGERYDSYEPWEYNAISIHDECIEPLSAQLNTIDMFWHTLDVPGKGLAYCGITLIPPSAHCDVLKIIRPKAGLEQLTELVQKAAEEEKYIIHFGL